MPGGAARTAPVRRPAVAMLARSPRVPGKTRLTSGLPEPAAQALRLALLLDTAAVALATGWPLHLFVTPDDEQAAVRDTLAADAALGRSVGQCHVHPQATGDLGARMADAMGRTLLAGHDAVVLVGSDLPALPLSALTAAVAALSEPEGERRLVFGPSGDGGFYLVAGRRAWPEVFDGVAWSRETVLAHTEARAHAVGLDLARVEPCADVDVRADLERVLRTSPPHRAPRTRRWALEVR